MNWLPTPPTDNLHKYIALNGLWFAYAILALLAFLHYQNFEHQEFNKRQSWLFSKQESARKFDTRLVSLAKGTITENAIPGISDQFSPNDEKVILQKVLSSTREEISSLADQTKNQPNNLFPLLAHFHIDVWLIIIALASSVCSYAGFRNWAKYQRVADEIQRIDLELKRHQLKEANRVKFSRRG